VFLTLLIRTKTPIDDQENAQSPAENIVMRGADSAPRITLHFTNQLPLTHN